MSKQFWAIIAVVILALVGVFVLGNKHDNKTSSSSKSSGTVSNHVMGSTSTGVKLVEYGDYQCPFCGQFYPIVKQVADQYKDKIQFQFRNLPLNQVHKNAFAAARAAEAASLQGKFWEMHDTLYENQDHNGASGWVVSNDPLNEYFVNFAKQAGIADIEKFKTDFASSAVNDTINADIDAFNKTGQEMSTPNFFLDGKHVQFTYDIASFQKAIDAEIKLKAGK